MVQKRRALISQQGATETGSTIAPQRKKDFVDIILLSKVGKKEENFRDTFPPKAKKNIFFLPVVLCVGLI